MNSILSIMAAIALIAAIALWKRKPRLALANIAEGTHPGGITRKTDAVISTRFLLAKPGTDAAHIDICTASDIPIGVITDEAAAIEDYVAVNLLGCAKSTQLVQCSGVVSAGALISPDAAGQVKTLPTSGAGTYYAIGRALTTTAAQGDLVEFDPLFFRVVLAS